MAEAQGSPPTDVDAELDRIERAMERGSDDLGALGFWRLVERVKRDPALIERCADRIGEIDGAAFRSRVRLRVPVWAGNAALIAGVVAGGIAVALALSAHSSLVAGLALIVAGGIWSVCLHCPAHWVAGRLAGIRFTDYFIGGPPPPRPGLKTDYASYLRADPSSRARMHAAGAIATKLAPFVALAFWPASGAPWWSAAGLGALGALQIATDLLFSVRSSDWKKFRRERAVARAGRRGSRAYTPG